MSRSPTRIGGVFEIGNSLREARIRQGLGYPEIELATKIRAKYIRALEEEDFSTLPADPYIRGFLRAYADYLGLDGQLYVDEYASRFVSSWPDDAPPERPSRSRRPAVERRGVVLALAGIAALAALVIVAWKFGGVDSSSPPAIPPAASRRTAASALVLRGVGKGSYVEVRRNSAAGRVLLQATVSAGGTEELSGSRFYRFVKRPEGLRVRLGGKPVSLPAHRNLRVLVTPTRTERAGG